MLTAIQFHIGLTEAEKAAFPADLVPGRTYLLKWSRLETPMRAQLRVLPYEGHDFIEFWVFLDDEFKIGPAVQPDDV
jgi:hypothetical protein